jgi:hypothetical protein
MSAEITGSAAMIEALLSGADPAPDSVDGTGEEIDDAMHPLLVAGLAAARRPAFRVWTEGIDPGVTALGDRAGSVLVLDEPTGERTLVGMSSEEVPLALAGAVDLGPRPVPDGPPVRLPPAAMAELIGRGQAHGHGLPPADADALGRRLEPGVRHWSVRCFGAEGQGGERRGDVEVVEGDGGIWRVRTADGVVELAPTSSTAVLRDLVALLGEPPAARGRGSSGV